MPIPFHGLHLLPEQVYLSNFWKYTQVYFPKCSTVYKKSTIHVLLQNMCVYVCCCVHVCTLTNPIYLCWQSALLIFSSYVQFFQSNTIVPIFTVHLSSIVFSSLQGITLYLLFAYVKELSVRWSTSIIIYTIFIYTFDLPHFVCTTSIIIYTIFYIHIWFATLCLYTKISSFYYMPKHCYSYRTLMYSLDSHKLSFIAAEKMHIFFFPSFQQQLLPDTRRHIQANSNAGFSSDIIC